jgi:hypothetical protein
LLTWIGPGWRREKSSALRQFGHLFLVIRLRLLAAWNGTWRTRRRIGKDGPDLRARGRRKRDR